MAEVQWGILGDTAQLGNTFLKAYEAGNSMRIAKGKESALAKYATDPEGAASELMRYDPESALVLQKQNAGNKAAADRRAVLGSYQADPKAARQQAYATGDIDLIKQLQSMDEEQRALALERGQTTARIMDRLGRLTYEERKAAIQKMAPDLVSQLGFTPEQIANADPTDAWVDAQQAQYANFQKAAQLFNVGGKIIEAAPGGEGRVLYDGTGAGQWKAEGGNMWFFPADGSPPVKGDAITPTPKVFAPKQPRAGRGGSGGGLPPGFELE